ncbi:N utilization substance protein A [Acholeplasma morum]|uniref:transcription termination factor NusA n=1 Tax=Paracholeplasma morum TaxID=264637 RepID=UPI00195C0ABE|nr:transcription termination factor NusA [Paracholeplasma morum]MBM7453502.1 N utilization substance protein A [Paracholeplasma morum]
MVSKEFFRLLEVIADERNIPVEMITDAFVKGMVVAFKKSRGHASCRVELNPEKNEIMVYEQHLVVSDEGFDLEADPTLKQMKLSDAKKIKSRIKVGDILEESINPKEFSQTAVVNLKNVLNQHLKSIEKDNVYNYFKEREKEMVIAKVIGEDDDYYRLDLGKELTTLLPKREALPTDKFVVGESIKVFIASVEMKTKGPKVLVTRLDKSLVKRLFENLIPEIKDGTVEIMGIARDAGDRTKVGVMSNDKNVDAIGACIGENSSRIKEIVRALSGEKVDLFLWSTNERDLIANSLQPAEVLAVTQINPIKRTALAVVADDKLSLAIGKAGQNVKLAVQAINWKIDIKSASMADAEGIIF